jgi:hypothetical protein
MSMDYDAKSAARGRAGKALIVAATNERCPKTARQPELMLTVREAVAPRAATETPDRRGLASTVRDLPCGIGP